MHRGDDEPAFPAPPPWSDAGSRQALKARATQEPAQHMVVVCVTADGAPAPGASVVIQVQRPRSTTVVLYEETDEYGTAAFRLPAERQKIVVSAYAGDYAAVSVQTNLPQRARGQVRVAINLSDPGVLITAAIISSEPFAPRSMQARIIAQQQGYEAALSAAFATNVQNDRIVFPPIRRGLRGLYVELRNAGMPDCRSEVFDTLDGADKTVLLDIPERARLYVIARSSSMQAVTSLWLRAQPLGSEHSAYVPPFNGALAASDAGTFVSDALVPAMYLMQFTAPLCQPLATNVNVAPGDTTLDIVLRAMRFVTIRGQTVMYGTSVPATNVLIVAQAGPQQTGAATMSDHLGLFSLDVGLKQDDVAMVLTAARAGLCTAYVTIPPNYDGEELLITMHPAARSLGHVRTQQGQPVEGVHVNARVNTALHAIREGETNATRSFTDGLAQRPVVTYGGRTQAPTDSEGFYVIEHIAVPESYKLSITAAHCFVPDDDDPRVNAVDVTAPRDVTHDITVMLKHLVLVRALDEEQETVQKYNLRMETFGARGQGARVQAIDHRGREWAPVQIDNQLCYPGVRVALQAVTESAASAKSAWFDVCGAATNYVTLALTSGPPVVAGHVLMPDGTPAAAVRVTATAQKSGSSTFTVSDHLGYFEIHGLQAAPAELIGLRAHAWQERASAQTNVMAGDLRVELLLSSARTVTGRVCYEYAGMPATNFTVSLAGGGARKTYTPTDGSFTYYLNAWNARENVTLYVAARGYASEAVPVTFGPEDVCDVGTVILRAESASVRGRVVTQDGEPVAANVFALVFGDAARATRLSVRSHPDSGQFVFTDLPVVPMQVEARTPLATVQSEVVTPRAGQVYEMPDLVIATSNGVRARLTFVLPDGTPAAGMYVERFQAVTDARGTLVIWTRPGRFANLRVLSAFAYQNNSISAYPVQGSQIYYSEAFVVTFESSALTIRLYSTATITGSVVMDGTPYNGALVLQRVPGGPQTSTTARDGTFAAALQAGRYLAISRAWHTAAMCDLRPQQDNLISLRSGSGVVTVYYPWRGTWACTALLNVNGVFANVAGSGMQTDVTQTRFDGMPGGEYQFTARCSSSGRATNVAVRAFLSDGATMSVTIP